MPPQIVESYGEVSPDGVEHLPVVAAKIARAASSEKPALCVRSVSDFLTTDPVPTPAPIGRAS
jgi:hypothetical protein